MCVQYTTESKVDKPQDALKNAIICGDLFTVLDLLKLPIVRENAGGTLKEVMKILNQEKIKPESWAIFFELLKLPSFHKELVQVFNQPYKVLETDYHLYKNSNPFIAAIKSRNLSVIFKLLEQPFVVKYLETNGNEILNITCFNKDWLVFLELLQHEKVKENLTNNPNNLLYAVWHAKELGILSLLLQIYQDRGFLVPEEIEIAFKDICEKLNAECIATTKNFKSTTDCLFKVVELVSASIQRDVKESEQLSTQNELLTHLNDIFYQRLVLVIANHLVLQYAAIKGYSKVVARFLEMEEGNTMATIGSTLLIASMKGDLLSIQALLPYVKAFFSMANAMQLPVLLHNKNNAETKAAQEFIMNVKEAFNYALYFGQWKIVLELLKTEIHMPFDIFLPLKHAVHFEHWDIAFALLENPRIKIDNIFHRDFLEEGYMEQEDVAELNRHEEILRIAIDKEHLPMICALVKLYQEKNIELPEALTYKGHPLITLAQDIQILFKDISKSMYAIGSDGHTWTNALSDLAFAQYAGFTTDLDPRVAPVVFRTLPGTRTTQVKVEQSTKLKQLPAV